MVRNLLALALLLFPAIAHAEWHEASTRHFTVFSEERPERLRQFATELEQFDRALRLIWQVNDPDIGPANRVTVYVVDNVEAVERLIGRNVAGVYIPRAGGSLAIVPRGTNAPSEIFGPRHILFHEYAHHFMLSSWAYAAFPRWFVEGFAEMHSTARFDRQSLTFGDAPAARAWGLRRGNPLPIDQLLAIGNERLDGRETEAIYGRGWLLTHYLTFGDARPGQLWAYIRAINAGQTPAQAAAAFGDPRALTRELDRYMDRRTLTSIAIQTSVLTIGPVTVRPLTPGEAALMEVRIESKRGVDEESAPPVYARARTAAAPFPGDPGAQIVLAETAYDARAYAEAEAAADRALAADPRAVDALVYKAMARMALARDAGDTTTETWDAIREIIASARMADPLDPEPMVLFYQSFAGEGRAPTAEARAAMMRAVSLGPQDRNLRLDAAVMLLNGGDGAGARRLLGPVAYDPHSGSMAGTAARLIAAIDRGDIEGGLRELARGGDGGGEESASEGAD